MTVANHHVTARTLRNLSAAGNIAFTAKGHSDVSSTATASSAGAKGESGGGKDSSGKDSNQKADDQLALGNDKSNASAGKDSGKSSTPKNGSAESEGSSVSVAAAIAFTIVDAQTLAWIGPVAVVSSNGSIALHSQANDDAASKADGKASNGSTATIGAAVAVTLATALNQSGMDPAGTSSSKTGFSALAEMLQAGVTNERKNTFKAEAVSGAGGSGTVGVAGSLALTIVDVKTLALLLSEPGRGPPSVAITGTGDVSLTASSSSESSAAAKAEQSGSEGTVGVGASVAINLVNDSTQAGLQDAGPLVLDPAAIAAGPVVTGAHDLTIAATQAHTLTTSAEGGAGGAEVSINPNVAILIANLDATASIGRGPALGGTFPAAGLTGTIGAKADQSISATTTAKGAVDSPTSVGVAVSLALAIVDAKADSSSRRNLHAAGSIGFQAVANVSSTALAEASASGAKKKDGEDTNQTADKNLGDAKQKQSTNTGKSTDKSETPKASTDEDSGASVSVAGAVAINIITTASTARLADGSTVRSDSAAVSLSTQANTDAIATAKGDTAVEGSVGVGVGVAINSVDLTNAATTGTATIDAVGLTVSATMRQADGADQIVRRWDDTHKEWVEVASGDKLPTSPSDGDYFRLTAKDGTTEPGTYKRVSGGWVLQTVSDGTSFPAAPAADALFRLAEHDVLATATAGASKTDDVGVAGALALDIVVQHTTAVVPAGAVVHAGSGAVTVAAQTNGAVKAAGNSTQEGAGGSVGVGAGVGIVVLTPSITRAALEDGAVLVGGGALTVSADQLWVTIEATSTAGSKGDDVNISPAVALAIVTIDTVARIGTGADISTTGAVAVKASGGASITNKSDAKAAGDDVAVGAAVSVVVLTPTTTAAIDRNLTGASVAVLASSDDLRERRVQRRRRGQQQLG